jgi:hypothetical protein
MTADIEALMSSRDRDPVKYVSLSAEFAPNTAQIHTEALYAERVQTPACTDVCTETGSQVERAAEAAATAETEADEPTVAAEETQDAAAAGPSTTVKLVYVPPGSSPEDADALVERAVADVKRESLQRQATAVYPEPRRAIAPPAVELPRRQGTVSTVPLTTGPSGALIAEATSEATAIAPKRSHHKRKRAKRKPRPIPALEQVTLRPAAPRKQSQPKSQTEIDLARHERRCSVCHHPERDAIEEAFLQWRSVRSIDIDFEPEGGRTAIYRHARALKLFKQRNLSLRSSLEFVIEQAEHVMPTAEGLVKAIRAYTRINDAGECIDTPTTHIVKVMPMVDPEPRNVTNSASVYPDNGRAYPACPDAGRDAGRVPGSNEESASKLKNAASSVTLDVKKISDCPRESRVEVTVESPSGRPFLTGSAPQTEIDATT